MAIEFSCIHCGRRLKVPDEAAGKQAQCPMCNGLSPVPVAGWERPADWEQPGRPGSQYDGSVAGDTGGAGGAFNPYAAAAAGDTAWSSELNRSRRQVAAAKVSGPATALVVLGIMGIIFFIIGVATFVLGVGLLALEPQGPGRDVAEELAVNVVLGSVQSVIGFVVSVLILIGAIKMYRLKSHGWATAAAILAIIPCVSPCCILGLPFGIWALVALGDPVVKAAFGQIPPSQASF